MELGLFGRNGVGWEFLPELNEIVPEAEDLLIVLVDLGNFFFDLVDLESELIQDWRRLVLGWSGRLSLGEGDFLLFGYLCYEGGTSMSWRYRLFELMMVEGMLRIKELIVW